MIRTLVVDDEELARERVVQLLRPHESIELIGECSDGLQAVEQICAQKPDLVFLDIQMPGLDGFEVLAALAEDERPVVVFITAYDEHALRAFDVHAIDYLLKPIEVKRFEEALRRAQSCVQGAERQPVVASFEGRARPERIVGRRGSTFVVLPHDEIMWIEAAGNYLRVHSSSGESLVRSTMKDMTTRLGSASFLRIHRSMLVGLAHVRALTSVGHGEYELELSDGHRLKCSRAYGADVRRAFRE